MTDSVDVILVVVGALIFIIGLTGKVDLKFANAKIDLKWKGIRSIMVASGIGLIGLVVFNYFIAINGQLENTMIREENLSSFETIREENIPLEQEISEAETILGDYTESQLEEENIPARILSPLNGDFIVADHDSEDPMWKVNVDIMGEGYEKDMYLWIIVWPEYSEFGYPQAFDIEKGKGVGYSGDYWNVRAYLQSDREQVFLISLYSVDTVANELMVQYMKMCYESGDYSGMAEDELPSGFEEIESVMVVLKDEM